jgi:hypothetical protein
MSTGEGQIPVTDTYTDLYPEHYAHPMGRCLIRNGICVAEGRSRCSLCLSQSRGGAPLQLSATSRGSAALSVNFAGHFLNPDAFADSGEFIP